MVYVWVVSLSSAVTVITASPFTPFVTTSVVWPSAPLITPIIGNTVVPTGNSTSYS